MRCFPSQLSGIRHGARCARWCLGIVVTISAAACAPSPDQPRFTVDYYRAHAPEREAKLAACENDRGGLGRTPDCANAREAARIEGVGSLRDLPPLDLPTDTPKADEKRADQVHDTPEDRR